MCHLGVSSGKTILESTNKDDAEDTDIENDPLQPIKRRRITSIDPKSIDRMATMYRKPIVGRPPIRRILNHD